MLELMSHHDKTNLAFSLYFERAGVSAVVVFGPFALQPSPSSLLLVMIKGPFPIHTDTLKCDDVYYYNAYNTTPDPHVLMYPQHSHILLHICVYRTMSHKSWPTQCTFYSDSSGINREFLLATLIFCRLFLMRAIKEPYRNPVMQIIKRRSYQLCRYNTRINKTLQ